MIEKRIFLTTKALAELVAVRQPAYVIFFQPMMEDPGWRSFLPS